MKFLRDEHPKALLCGVGLTLGLLLAGTVGAQQSVVDEATKLPEAAGAALAGDSQAGAPGPRPERPMVLKLAGQHFDPLEALPADTLSPRLPAEKLAAPAPDRLFYIVQLDGPIEEAWKTDLRSSGAELFDYIPDYAFIVRLRADDEEVIRGLPHVRWLGEYRPMYRVSQAVADAQLTGVDRQGRDVSQAARLRVILFPGEDVEAIESGIVALGGSIRDRVTTKWKTTLAVDIPTSGIPELAALNGVKWVETEPIWRMFNNKATDIMGVRVPRDAHGLYGEGQTVGVADTGLDQGSASAGSLHDDFEDGSGSSRVVQIFDVAGDGASDVNSGHGTHVAGSVLGNGANSGSNPLTSSFPSSCFAGIAPKAHLVMQATENNTTGGLVLPVDLNTLFAQSAGAGADLHTNSWGSDEASAYTSSSAEVDQYMWDHKDFLILFAAGNSGGDLDGDGVIDPYSIGAPASAKNCLTVGASENERPSGEGADINWGSGWYEFPADPIYSDHVSDQPWGMAAFSSRGPVLDGRYKPDIVAPGTNILSTRSSLAAGSGWGPFDSYYFYMGGTSMSTPLTAGAAALLREYLTQEAGIAAPSAALLKAALLNSAEDIAPGQYGTGATLEIPATPNDVAGWGRVNLSDGVFPAAPYVIQYRDRTTGLSTGGYESFDVTLAGSTSPLKITLVWTDYPGSAAVQGGLVNDLDLQVTDPSATVHYGDGAVQMSSLSTLQYDSGASSSVSSTARRAMRMTPASYPVSLESTTFYFFNNGTTADVAVVVYDDDGAGGTPGSELFRKTLTYVPSGFTTVGIDGVIVTSGDVYVALELGSANHYLFVDNGNPTGRSYYFDGASWVSSGFTPFIRAHVRGSAYSTSFDRVNNVVGLTLPSPATGTYTIRVSGYNVPYGPQPYALVVSGEIAHTLTVSKNGTGGGTVTSSPAGISCGADCSEDYAGGTMVTLTATPDATSTFIGWSGEGCAGTGTCVVTMDAAKAVTATFSAGAYTLSVTRAGAGQGTVTSSPAGIDCGGTCAAAFDANSEVTLTAVADAGSSFVGWSGACSSVGAEPCALTMAGAMSVTSYFEPAAASGDTWLTREQLPTARVGAAAASVDGLVYVTGGGNGYDSNSTDVMAFDPADGTWTVKAPMQTSRQYHTAVALDGAIYVMGGLIGWPNSTAAVEMYDPGTDTWTSKAPMQTGRWSFAAAASGGKIYVFGGNYSMSSVEEYDPATDSWTYRASLSTVRRMAAAAAIDGLIYVVGGCLADCTAGDGYLETVEAFDPGTNTWSTRAPLSTGRTGLAAVAFEGHLYAYGGNAGTGLQAGSYHPRTVEQYDPVTDSWRLRTPLSVGRIYAASAEAGGRLYFMGGIDSFDGNLAARTANEEYTPPGRHELDVAKAGTGSGTVSSNPARIDCGTRCSAWYDAGVTVTLAATPDATSTFTGWSGAGCSGTGTCVVTMDAAKAVTATFTPTCTYSIDPTSESYTPSGGSGTVAVTSASGCGWTAVSNDAWITVTSGAGGSGDGSVDYSVAASTGSARTGTVTIAGQTFTVTQSALFADIGVDLTAVHASSVAWGDYDDDGDLDILITGLISGSSYVAKVYRNDDGGVFTDVGAGLTGVGWGSTAWGDYDNDGDLDILLTGYGYNGSSNYNAKVYRNDSGGAFTDIGAELTGVYDSSVAWGDYDNDGDLDILLAGYNYPTRVTKVYRNNGGGAFTDIAAELTGVHFGSVAWGDYDNDGDLDILLSGSDEASSPMAQVYRNDGEGIFTDITAGLPGVYQGGGAWGDYDNDGDLDILLTGATDSGRISKVYRNDGSGTFIDIGAGLTGVNSGSAAWGDYDNDGDLDILLTGTGSSDTKVYRNDGAGVFTDIEAGVPQVGSGGSVAWGDYDNDGDLDILLTGFKNGSSPNFAAVFRNDTATANAAPGAPSSLAASVGANDVSLSWAAAGDAQTPAAGLTYNLRVGTSPGAMDVVSPMAAGSGYRRIPALGNAQHGTTAAVLAPPDPGIYYWSVQAVDTSFAGSAFAGDATFTVCGYSVDPTSQGIGPAGGGSSVAVIAPPGCAWTAVSNDAWITVTSGSSGSGNGSVGYSVAANTGTARTGTLTIAGQTFTVNQSSGCTYAIDPTSASYDLSGGSGSVSVTAGSGCGWTAVSNAAWITVTSGANGNGNGSVGYSVAANPGPPRIGTLTIAGHTHTVVQPADIFKDGFESGDTSAWVKVP